MSNTLLRKMIMKENSADSEGSSFAHEVMLRKILNLKFIGVIVAIGIILE